MKKIIVAALIVASLVGLGITYKEKLYFLLPPNMADAASQEQNFYEATGKITFYELGSVGCKPCDAMKPVMKLVEDKYGDFVDVIFYDVKKDISKVGKYKVMLIPTQVFTDAEGRETFRHQGYLAFDDVETVLMQMGVEPK